MKSVPLHLFQLGCLALYLFQTLPSVCEPADHSQPTKQGKKMEPEKHSSSASTEPWISLLNPDLFTDTHIIQWQRFLNQKQSSKKTAASRDGVWAIVEEALKNKHKITNMKRKGEWECISMPLVTESGKTISAKIHQARYSFEKKIKGIRHSRMANVLLRRDENKDALLVWIVNIGRNPGEKFLIESKGNIYIFGLQDFVLHGRQGINIENYNATENFDTLLENAFAGEHTPKQIPIFASLRYYFTSSFFSAHYWAPNLGKTILRNVTARDGVFCFEIENITAGDRGKIWVDLDKKKIVDVEETTNPGRDERPIWERSFEDGQTEPASIPRIRNRFFLGNPDLHAPWLCRTIEAKRKMLGEEYEKAEKVREKDAAAFLEQTIDEEDSFLVKERTSEWKKTTMPLVRQTGEVVPIQIDYARHAVTGTKNSKSVTEEMDLVLIRDYFGEKNLIWIGSLTRDMHSMFFHKKTDVFFIENDGDIYVCSSYGSFLRITGGAVVDMEDALTSSSKNFDRMVEAAYTREYLSKRTTFCLFLKYYFTTHLFSSDLTKNTLCNVTAKDGVFCFEIENTQGGDKGKFWVNLAEKKLVNVEEITNPERNELLPSLRKIEAENSAKDPKK
jgi:hypothetical protein